MRLTGVLRATEIPELRHIVIMQPGTDPKTTHCIKGTLIRKWVDSTILKSNSFRLSHTFVAVGQVAVLPERGGGMGD